ASAKVAASAGAARASRRRKRTIRTTAMVTAIALPMIQTAPRGRYGMRDVSEAIPDAAVDAPETKRVSVEAVKVRGATGGASAEVAATVVLSETIGACAADAPVRLSSPPRCGGSESRSPETTCVEMTAGTVEACEPDSVGT